MKFPDGLSAFPVTPASSDAIVDVEALRKLVSPLAAAKVDSIGVLGSTGTYMYLSREERRRAISASVEAAGDIPIIAGVGALRTDEAVRLAQEARAEGAVAGLLAPVSYTPLNDDEVFEHFSAVARESKLPICIYDNPGTTHFKFTPHLVGRLSRVDGIVAIKSPASDAATIGSHLGDLQAAVRDGFSLGYSGDWNTVEGLIAGAATWYSVLGGLLPQVCFNIVRAVQDGNVAEARRLNVALEPVWSLFKEFSSLRVMYAVAELRGDFQLTLPRPILPLAPAAKAKVAQVFNSLSPDLTR